MLQSLFHALLAATSNQNRADVHEPNLRIDRQVRASNLLPWLSSQANMASTKSGRIKCPLSSSPRRKLKNGLEGNLKDDIEEREREREKKRRHPKDKVINRQPFFFCHWKPNQNAKRKRVLDCKKRTYSQGKTEGKEWASKVACDEKGTLEGDSLACGWR